MKTCSKCQEEKELSQFNRKGERLQPYCKDCDRQHSREQYAKNKEKMRKQIYAARKKKNLEYQKFIRELKESKPCMDCGVSYPYYVMDFDHQRDKEFLISRAVTWGKGKEAILKEIEKCELVCANCHRIRTHKNKQSGIA